jgi:hypothetical protein
MAKRVRKKVLNSCRIRPRSATTGSSPSWSWNESWTTKTGGLTEEYVVTWTAIVEPDDLSVTEATPEPSLTRVTCYPFRFVGTAPEHFVVRASRIDPNADTTST